MKQSIVQTAIENVISSWFDSLHPTKLDLNEKEYRAMVLMNNVVGLITEEQKRSLLNKLEKQIAEFRTHSPFNR